MMEELHPCAFAEALKLVKQKNPLVHCITNGVALNDCANILLALGARPVMAEAPEESAEITSKAAALSVSLGMLTRDKREAIFRSMHAAKEKGIPVLLDPVGIGASAFRQQAFKGMIETGAITVLKGNRAEMHFLTGETDPHKAAERAAQLFGCTAAVTGETDYVSDGENHVRITGGTPLLARITATGCMASVLCAAFLAVMPEKPVLAAACGIAVMNHAGELAETMAKACSPAHEIAVAQGSFLPGSFHACLFDAVPMLAQLYGRTEGNNETNL